MTVTREHVTAVLNTYIESYRAKDKATWLTLFADNIYFADPVGKPAMEGLDAMSAFWEQAHNSGMTLMPELERIVVCGTEAILQFTMEVRDANGGGFDLKVVDNFEFDPAGKVVRLRAFWDRGSMLPVASA
jgi:steroid delta-isomerase